ncbi:hypothetical protein N7481_010725 [Penicillium waksmanii]|uniref:uncharacterized protein n=1 Tax=Penicillium waksmanii TaxID=69791 RepID=UPI002546F9DA|nr:uncharacterized protein N7481_010725 [Penicillium waksmanii]KAJ5973515.1 hypothetical protein N7481_010725 [Penicillium waksmanii]
MAKVIFTAWKDQSQLLDVRSKFYPSASYEGPDLRSHACATVEAWKLRGNVPHHVEATALLTDAILHDDAQHNSIFSIRATYSAAFCRFVTGLVDSKIQGPRKTMFQRAVDLGLPASFVELRHEATHREPPSLVVLRKASQRSLEWLWDNYWAGIDELGDVPMIERNDIASIGSALGDILRKYSTESEQSQKKRKRDEDDALASQLISTCAASDEGVKLLPAVLLEESVLIDSERQLGESLNKAFKHWDPVLLKITESSSSFFTHFAEALVNRLAFDPAIESPQNAYAEALYLWLDHISTSYVLSACEQCSSHWTQTLSKELEKKGKATKVAPVTIGNSSKLKRTSSKSSMHVETNISSKLSGHGWEPLQKWDSRPLGISSIN